MRKLVLGLALLLISAAPDAFAARQRNARTTFTPPPEPGVIFVVIDYARAGGVAQGTMVNVDFGKGQPEGHDRGSLPRDLLGDDPGGVRAQDAAPHVRLGADDDHHERRHRPRALPGRSAPGDPGRLLQADAVGYDSKDIKDCKDGKDERP